jgi:cellobiose phosphorylase
MHSTAPRFRIHTNGRLRSHVLPGGQGGLFHDWVALTRYSEAAPLACGPMLYLRENGDWKLADELGPDDKLTLSIQIGIPPEADVEIRCITLSNTSANFREIELTSYAEIALNHPMGDAGHPAFSKLFVQTSVNPVGPFLFARRRPRGLNENWPWIAQTLLGADSLSWETNRVTFLGRGRTPLAPAAMDASGPLSKQTGNVLDPVMAWRGHISLAPAESREIWLVTAAASDEATTTSLLERHASPAAAAAALAQANAAAEAKLENLGITVAAADTYDALAATLLFGRADRTVPASLCGADVLGRHPLSGEQIRVIATAGMVAHATQELLSALPYWRVLGLQVRLFVMDAKMLDDLPQDVTIVDPTDFSADEMTWWLASAQLVVGEEIPATSTIPMDLYRPVSKPYEDVSIPPDDTLQLFNGHGGFSENGREYVIPLPLKDGALPLPPMPWVNILANPDFGCMVTERGAGYTWSRNSQANRLTPWSNDPVKDPHGEAFYLRDDDTGDIWSPLPGPCPPRTAYTVRHGFGRTRFFSETSGIHQEVEFLVPVAAPVKLVTLRLRNESTSPRKLSFACWQKLILGSMPDRHHATLAWTAPTRTQHAVNPRAGDFAGGRAFAFATLHGAAITSSATNQSTATFLGSGSPAAPALLYSHASRFVKSRMAVPAVSTSGRLACGLLAQASESQIGRRGRIAAWTEEPGFGLDACFSRLLSFTLEPGAEVEIVIGLGEAMSEAIAEDLATTYQKPGAVKRTNAEVDAQWHDLLDKIQIKTPLPEINLMANGWLLYQNLACRIWGRSAFYQSGGAFGFRDQLQDSSALAALHPELMRSQILLHAAQQFPEGDVTHWWHPAPMNRGMRTNFSDDLLWLPYLTQHYLHVTGDDSVLDERRRFIHGPLLGPGEDEEYMKPEISDRAASVFEHCCLAIDHSLTTGAHGLPLIGIGDWNDGMSRIGREGCGESVWMGFFLYAILGRWIPLCETRGEHDRAMIYQAFRDDLLVAVNDAGWDGEWYRRAYYDDGTPLGTADGDECRIDALAQAWAVISGAAPDDRAKLALDSLERLLVDPAQGLIRLLTPPFVNTPHDPGYIKGYVAGVRENGGQYTHAACWVIRAMAEVGRRDEAAALLQRLSPIWHSRDAEAVSLYQVEPYVVAADIYGAPPHIGRGGWTWYTGSAAWMFRVTLESVLGLTVENGTTLVLAPRIPDSWPGFSIAYRTISGKTLYRIQVNVTDGCAKRITQICVDGQSLAPTDGVARWPILDDGGEHPVCLTLGE